MPGFRFCVEFFQPEVILATILSALYARPAGVKATRTSPVSDGDDNVCIYHLIDVFQEAGNGEIGDWIIPDEQGQGYATAAAGLVVKHAVHDQGLDKRIARTLADNEASKRVLEKHGFEQEGRFRDHHYRNGDRKDMSLVGLTRPEWEAQS